MSILVCGGAGYIGSHAVHQLVAKGEDVVIVDNLQTGHRDALNPKAKFYEGDIREAEVLDKIFTENQIDAVIHFAANSRKHGKTPEVFQQQCIWYAGAAGSDGPP